MDSFYLVQVWAGTASKTMKGSKDNVRAGHWLDAALRAAQILAKDPNVTKFHISDEDGLIQAFEKNANGTWNRVYARL